MVNFETIKNVTSELIESTRNKITELSNRIQSTDFYSDLPEFIKKTGGWIALTPLPVIFLFVRIKNSSNTEKIIKKRVSDPKIAKDIATKLVFLEPGEDYPASKKIINNIHRNYRIYTQETKPSGYPADSALIYFALTNHNLIPISYDGHILKEMIKWPYLPKFLSDNLKKNIKNFKSITAKDIESNNKYILDANIFIHYEDNSQQGREIRNMFDKAIKDDTITLFVIPTVLEEIDKEHKFHKRFY